MKPGFKLVTKKWRSKFLLNAKLDLVGGIKTKLLSSVQK
jgi:hypothetical protein